jgi:hypothetical protein
MISEFRQARSLLKTLKFNHKLNLLWISIGVGLGALAIGSALRGSEPAQVASLVGHCLGVLLQGGFLLLFDRRFEGGLRQLPPLARDTAPSPQ